MESLFPSFAYIIISPIVLLYSFSFVARNLLSMLIHVSEFPLSDPHGCLG